MYTVNSKKFELVGIREIQIIDLLGFPNKWIYGSISTKNKSELYSVQTVSKYCSCQWVLLMYLSFGGPKHLSTIIVKHKNTQYCCVTDYIVLFVFLTVRSYFK